MMLTNLDLREVVMEAASQLLDSEMNEKVNSNMLNTEQSRFDKLTSWFTHVLLRFISYTVSHTGEEPTYLWKDQMLRKLAVSFTNICTKEFITLIQEFPESTPCLKDLKRALAVS